MKSDKEGAYQQDKMVKLQYSKDKTKISIIDPTRVNPYNKGIVAFFDKKSKEGFISKDLLRNTETPYKQLSSWKSAVESRHRVKLPEL